MDASGYEQWYATPRGRWIGERELTLIHRLLAPRPEESLLDVGCGTGYFTRGLAAGLTGPIYGLDIATDWVAYAQQHHAAGIQWLAGDARALPIRDDSVDLAISITALCFVDEERRAVRELVRTARRRVAIGLLNRRSLLWWQKGRHGGSGAYTGARWHSPRDALALFQGLPVRNVRMQSAIWLPGGGGFARWSETLWLRRLHAGAFLLVVADVVS